MNGSPEGKLRRLAILCLAAWAAGCAAPAVRAGASDPLFRGLAADAWTQVGPVRTFGPPTLYEEIDGEAELFLAYGFRSLSVALVTPRGRPSAQLRVEIYRLGSRREAFGVYSQHRFPGQELAAAGPSEAIVSDASLDFFRGDRFVRLRAAGAGVSRSDLLLLGRDASAFLEGSPAPPPETEILRLPGLVPGTVVYHRRALLGYEGLAPGYEAKIERDGVAATLILLPPDGGSRPTEALLRGMPDVKALGGGRHRAPLRSGMLWISERGGFRFGAAGALLPGSAQALLDELDRKVALFLASGNSGRE